MAYERKADKERRIMLMSQVDNVRLPKDFHIWLHKCVFAYIMYFTRTGPRRYVGACQHCKAKNIPLKNPQQNKLGRCPHCHKPIRYRNSKHKHRFDETRWVMYVHKIKDGGFVLRSYRVYKLNDYLNYEWLVGEVERGITYNLRNVKYYQSRVDYPQPDKLGSPSHLKWINGEYNIGMGPIVPLLTWLYPNNLKKILPYEFKFCQIVPAARNTQTFIIPYLNLYTHCPQLEYIVKLKLYNLVEDLVVKYWEYKSTPTGILNLSSNNIKEVLRLNDTYFKFACKNNITLNELSILQQLQIKNIHYSKELLKFCVINNSYFDLRFYENKIFKYITLEALCKYAIQQKQLTNDNFVNDYEDYINACETLKYNLKDTMYLKPNDFKSAHDKSTELATQIKDKKLYDKVLKVLNSYRKTFNYIGKDYSLLVPETAASVVAEGKNQKHCVGGYLDRIAERRSIILFVRKTKEPDAAFFTLEIQPGNYNIVQCRGYGTVNGRLESNQSAPPVIMNFVQKTLDKIKPHRAVAS